MISKFLNFIFTVLVILSVFFLVAACNATPSQEEVSEPILKIGVVLDSAEVNDRGFNQFSVEGAQSAAEALDTEFTFVAPESTSDYAGPIQSLLQQDKNLIITVGFRVGVATADAAQQNPDVHFAILDNAYFPGAGCSEDVEDCYSEEGGLSNVTSLMFAEDQVAYLAGTLAGCMTETGTIATVAGLEIPPVVRFVTGYEIGAKTFNPDIVTMHEYIPDFDDPSTGQVVGQRFINEGADVIFVAAGRTGNGGLLAAHEAGIMAIGVDVDQYLSYEEVAPSLLTSAMKNVDVASAEAVNSFVQGNLDGGIIVNTLENGGVGLAPYHDWDDKIPQDCKDAVEAAREAVIADPSITGVQS